MLGAQDDGVLLGGAWYFIIWLLSANNSHPEATRKSDEAEKPRLVMKLNVKLKSSQDPFTP